jgi:hypothetical protein
MSSSGRLKLLLQAYHFVLPTSSGATISAFVILRSERFGIQCRFFFRQKIPVRHSMQLLRFCKRQMSNLETDVHSLVSLNVSGYGLHALT